MMTKLVAHRNVLKNLVVRDLQRRYVGSIGGFFWSVIHPLVLLGSYTFLFKVLGTPVDPRFKAYGFPVFMFCGLLPWLFFQDTVTRCCGSIVDNAVLITKTVIPAEILPISVMLSQLIHHTIGLGILLTVLIVFFQIHLSVLLILLYLPILLLLAQGLGWLLAGLQVFVRDTIQALQILTFFWFMFTPVLYDTSNLPEKLQKISRFNPMATIVTGYRNALLNQSLPNPTDILIAFGISLAVFATGALLFRQARPGFPDVL